jgi:hypothetical protein
MVPAQNSVSAVSGRDLAAAAGGLAVGIVIQLLVVAAPVLAGVGVALALAGALGVLAGRVVAVAAAVGSANVIGVAELAGPAGMLGSGATASGFLVVLVATVAVAVATGGGRPTRR